ncbi:MAG: sigma-70 family RNA polymerase sigma factor [Ignavibacterium sp.]|nr:sigma-70 family RNA polymerase sigma factor [Ignavibacterium sp.]
MENKKTEHQENYTTYEELEEYIKAFQNGDSEAGMKILESFKGFLKKYLMLIHLGVFNIKDKKMREFISLYMKGPKRKLIHQYKYRPAVRNEIYNTVNRIHSIFCHLNHDEIYQELSLGLLYLAKRYRIIDGKPRFQSYVNQVYHYEVKRRLKNLFYYESPKRLQEFVLQNHSTEENIEVDEWNVIQSHPSYPLIKKIKEDSIHTIEENEINEDWILGWSSSDNFSELTILERRIIKMYYWDDYSDQEIAEKLGMCRATINRYRLKAKKKIAKKAKQNNLLRNGCDDNE